MRLDPPRSAHGLCRDDIRHRTRHGRIRLLSGQAAVARGPGWSVAKVTRSTRHGRYKPGRDDTQSPCAPDGQTRTARKGYVANSAKSTDSRNPIHLVRATPMRTCARTDSLEQTMRRTVHTGSGELYDTHTTGRRRCKCSGRSQHRPWRCRPRGSRCAERTRRVGHRAQRPSSGHRF